MRRTLQQVVRISNSVNQHILIQDKANPVDPGNTLEEKWQDRCMLEFENEQLTVSDRVALDQCDWRWDGDISQQENPFLR